MLADIVTIITCALPFENCENFSLQYSCDVTWMRAWSSVLEVGPRNSLAPQPVTKVPDPANLSSITPGVALGRQIG